MKRNYLLYKSLMKVVKITTLYEIRLRFWSSPTLADCVCLTSNANKFLSECFVIVLVNFDLHHPLDRLRTFNTIFLNPIPDYLTIATINALICLN